MFKCNNRAAAKLLFQNTVLVMIFFSKVQKYLQKGVHKEFNKLFKIGTKLIKDFSIS